MTDTRTILGAEKATDPNKILPLKYNWAREHYKNGVANNWTPEEVPMGADIELWKKVDGLTEEERRMILWNLGFFSTAESLTANNIVLTIYKYVRNPECRQYILRQAYEEAVHTDTFIYCCDSLDLDPEKIYNMYNEIPSIQKKDQFVVEITEGLLDENFKLVPNDEKSLSMFLTDLISYYIIMEGMFFYAGFAMMLSLIRQKKMIGIGEQFQYILRNESVHLAFGVDLINAIKEENPFIWTPELKQKIQSHIERTTELECKFIKDALPSGGILGLNADTIEEYVKHIADRRLQSIRLTPKYNKANPFPWMAEIIDLPKEKKFFESRVTEYQQGGNLDW